MITRRGFLRRSLLVAGSAMAVPLVAACGGDDEDAAPTPTTSASSGVTPTTAPGGTSGGTTASTPGTGASPAASPGTGQSSQPTAAAVIKRGGTMIIGHQTSILSMDPAFTGEPQARTIRGTVAEGLFDLDAEGKLIPRLAESWEQKDPTTYVLKLRQGVKFHDGTDFDAEAVKFSIERMLNPETKNVWVNEISQTESVTVIDRNTVQLKSKTPFAAFLVPFFDLNGMVLSPAATQNAGDSINTKTVGTGPFQVVEFVKDDHVTLERNPNYWQSGKPYLDEITFRFIENDSTRLTELRSGGVQLIEYIPFQDVARAREMSEIVVSEKPGFRVDWLYFNTFEGPGQSKEFRQAFQHLIDRDAMQSVVYANTGAPAWDMLLPGTRFADPNYKPTSKDINKAKELLAKSGVQLPIDITLYETNDPVRLKETQVLQATCAEVGINIKVEIEDAAAYSARYRRYDFTMLWSWWGFRPDPDQYLGVNLETGGGWNWGRYSNPKMDELLKAERTEQDDAKRIQIFRQIAQLTTEDSSHIPYHYGSNFKALSPKVKGFVHRVDGLVRYGDIGLE